jgi:hypothetical protein
LELQRLQHYQREIVRKHACSPKFDDRSVNGFDELARTLLQMRTHDARESLYRIFFSCRILGFDNSVREQYKHISGLQIDLFRSRIPILEAYPARALLSAINHGEFPIHGFRNRDLRAIFFPQTTDDKQQTRRHSAWISRKLRLLRAHALITKIVGTHRYQVTSTGRKIIVAILSALRSTVAQLTPVTAQLTAVAA